MKFVTSGPKQNGGHLAMVFLDENVSIVNKTSLRCNIRLFDKTGLVKVKVWGAKKPSPVPALTKTQDIIWRHKVPNEFKTPGP